MSSLDWFLIIVSAVICIVQAFRGIKNFDLVLYEMIVFVISSIVALKWYDKLATALNIYSYLGLLFIYVIIVIILLIVANIIASQTEFSWEPFNAYLCFFFGFIISWSILYVLLTIGNLEPSGKIPLFNQESIKKSPVAQEILQFKTYNAIKIFLNKVSSGG